MTKRTLFTYIGSNWNNWTSRKISNPTARLEWETISNNDWARLSSDGQKELRALGEFIVRSGAPDWEDVIIDRASLVSPPKAVEPTHSSHLPTSDSSQTPTSDSSQTPKDSNSQTTIREHWTLEQTDAPGSSSGPNLMAVGRVKGVMGHRGTGAATAAKGVNLAGLSFGLDAASQKAGPGAGSDNEGPDVNDEQVEAAADDQGAAATNKKGGSKRQTSCDSSGDEWVPPEQKAKTARCVC